jgi:hypothetical protein
MKRVVVCVAAVAAIAVPSAAAGTAARHAIPLALPATTCGAGYVHARLSWGDKCLHVGEFCKVGNREYLRYGFYCPPTRHLRRR